MHILARKGLTLALVTFFLLLAGSIFVAPMKAANQNKTGVSVGDVVDYAFASPLQMSVSESAHISIDGITGSVVTYSSEVRYPSGMTVGGSGAKCNISTGDIWMHFLVMPGLKTGDPTYVGSPCYINDTGMMNVAFVNRMVNHALYPMDPIDGGGYADLYYDVETGLMVRYYYASNVSYLSMYLTSTSAFPSGISLVEIFWFAVDLIIVVVVVCVGLIRKRSVKTRKHSR